MPPRKPRIKLGRSKTLNPYKNNTEKKMERIVGEETMEFFKTLFETLDKDKTGQLERKELELALSACTSSEEDQEFLMNLVDDNQDGKLNINEFMFLMIIAEQNIEDCRKSVKSFEKYNTDKSDNQLDKKEVKALLEDLRQEINDTEFEELFSILDFDSSGKLNKVEFHMLYMAIQSSFEGKQDPLESDY